MKFEDQLHTSGEIFEEHYTIIIVMLAKDPTIKQKAQRLPRTILKLVNTKMFTILPMNPAPKIKQLTYRIFICMATRACITTGEDDIVINWNKYLYNYFFLF